MPGAAKHACALAPVPGSARIRLLRLSSSSPRTSPRFAQCCSLQPECSLKHSARTNRRALARAGLSLVIARKGHDASAETLLRVQPRAAHKLSYCHLHSAERLRAVREVHLPSFASTECDKKCCAGSRSGPPPPSPRRRARRRDSRRCTLKRKPRRGRRCGRGRATLY